MIASVAAADPRTVVPPLAGATEVLKLTPAAGFVDEPIAHDDQRLAYVVADAADKAELHVVTLTTKAELVVDIAPVTVRPIALELVGNRAFVVGQADEGKQIAALVELAGKKPGAIVYKLAAAANITVIVRDGRRVVAVHRAIPAGSGVRHEAELLSLESGQRIAGPHALELDDNHTNKALDFRVNHWSDGMTRAYGLKGGEWDPKENQRTPDVEATYDVVAGKLIDRHPIADLVEQRKRFQTLADVGNSVDFARMTWDNTAVQIWRAGKPKTIELDQPIGNYDPKSLQAVIAADGTAWVALKIDPVNPDAVARKKADPEYLDVFQVGVDGKGVRKARVLVTGTRVKLGTSGPMFWLLWRSNGSDRGGKAIAVYQLT